MAKKVVTSAFSLFSKSQQIVKNNLKAFAVLYTLPFLGDLISSFQPVETEFSPESLDITAQVLLFGGIFVLAVIIASLLIYTMLVKLELESAKSNKPSLSELWNFALSNWLKLFGLYIVLGFTIFVGLLLFIVPGIIFIRRYFLSPWVMFDQNLGIFASMRESSRITKGYTKAIWGIIGVYILISFTMAAPFVGIFIYYFLAVSYSVAPALRYFELKQ